MATAPGQSLPKQCQGWSDLKAAYRLLSNQRVDEQAIQRPHRRLTLQECLGHRVVLCVQDDTPLDFTQRTKVSGLGRIGDGGGRGIMQHTTLAVTVEGRLLGVLDQRWFNRPEVPPNQTRRQRQARWCESDVWADGVEAVATLCREHQQPIPTRFVHVADRGADVWTAMRACYQHQMGFVIRAKHDRAVQEGSRIWARLQSQPIAGTMTVQVTTQRAKGNRVKRSSRQAEVSISFARVHLAPPVNDPRCKHDPPQTVWAVYVREENPPADQEVEPIDWMLLTSEPVEDIEAAKRIIGWYRLRWIIEEWHRVLKEGCKIEQSQLDEATDIRRLAAILSVISVRMLQLRDLAGFGDALDRKRSNSDSPGSGGGTAEADDPAALQGTVPWTWIVVVAGLSQRVPASLTPRQFWLAIAQQGGYIGRRGDGRPGWKVIWRGWYDVTMMVRGAELHAADGSHSKCG
jgi:hypothetical protein